MSDGFDKEAEREKLRKRFEKEQQDRESTQVMSDLLLKGATMTNKHCNQCGDPVFRQSGQEFCPSCHGDGDGEATAAEESTGQSSADEPTVEQQPRDGDAGGKQPDDTTVTEQQQAASRPVKQAQAATTEQQAVREGQALNEGQQQTGDGDRQPAHTDSDRQQGQSAHQDRSEIAERDRFPAGAHDGTSDFDSAKASLATAIEVHADRATQADDPRDAREHLEAANEAANALATLREDR